MTLSGGVARVHAEREVERREDAEDEHRPVEPEHAEAGGVHEPPGEERERGDEQAEQPRVALGVAPGACGGDGRIG